MKPQHFLVLAGSLLLTVILLVVVPRPQQVAAPAPQMSERRVTAIGEGSVRVKPSLAMIKVEVFTYGASASAAEALNLASVEHVKEALAKAGADASHIDVTENLLSSVAAPDSTGTPHTVGFQVRTKVMALFRHVASVPSAVDAALEAGATALDRITYTIEDRASVVQDVMAQAFEDARQKAAGLTGAASESLGDTRAVEMLEEEAPASSASPEELFFRVKVRATFEF